MMSRLFFVSWYRCVNVPVSVMLNAAESARIGK